MLPAEENILNTRINKEKHTRLDWQTLRTQSLQPGGFGEERVTIWPKLLNASPVVDQKPLKNLLDEEKFPHQDERQIGLDTERSFVLYPVDAKGLKYDREILQAGLHELLVSLFRKRPRLSYFQGYHDIVTVFFLTLPQELQLACVEKLSLHRVRDSMGLGLEPVIGLLRVTKNLLHLVDPDYANVLQQSSPLPFYALSNLLTLFAHDMPTLPLIQHVFDYLLCRPPIAAVYLAAAIILSRKEEVLHLEEEGEEGMIHSLLSSFPNIADDAQDEGVAEDLPPLDEGAIDDLDNTFFKEEPLRTAASDEHVDRDFDPIVDRVKIEQDERPANNQVQGFASEKGVPASLPPLDEDDINNTFSKEELLQTAAPDGHVDRDFDPIEEHERPANNHEQGLDPDKVLQPDNEDDVRTARSSPKISELSPEHGEVGSATDEHILDKDEFTEMSATDPISIIPSNITVNDDEILSECSVCPKLTKLFLTDLLKHADTLYNTFPPSHPGLSLSSIMGPQSVVFTWSESSSSLPSDNTAEAMVSRPELVVYPFIETQLKSSKESSEFEEKQSKKIRRKHHKSPFSHMEKKTMVAGSVIVLGVAMAIYASRTGDTKSVYGIFHNFAEGHNGHTSVKDWRRLSGWVGGAVAGVTTKLMNGLSS